jgi:DNA-binding transcriptional regulator YiaG
MKPDELKTLRKNLGLSLSKAAKQVEVSPRTWCYWESGQIRISRPAEKLFRILNNLEKPQT